MRAIEEFLALRRVAIVGVSKDSKHFSRVVFRAFCERDFDVVPVNPAVPELEGKRCYARLQDINPAVEAVLIMTPPGLSESLVQDSLDTGVRRIWLYRRSPAAAALCAANGISVIEGECPLMFLPRTGWIHRFHGWLKGEHPVQLIRVS